ncbi:hypothetical protein IFM89_024646 [Coptis chinensis]|uniref:Uncharacterized protein n=1 Tax=Coptis chinensis TaxID=261450 RepID=A0A835LFL0_9MAGN|nr:hypothetical protein IFM89_024646 [Coptis chinensis]
MTPVIEQNAQITSGDHVEIQWRGNKELPYGWWYGVVGHPRLAMRLEVSAVVIRADIFIYGGYLRLCSPFHRHRNGCLDCIYSTTSGYLRGKLGLINTRVKFYFFDFADPSLNMLASGPYGLIFSSFVPFYFDIPVSTRHGFTFLELTSLTSRLYIWQVFSTFSHRGKDLCCQEYVVFLPVFSIVAIFYAYAASSSQSLSVHYFHDCLGPLWEVHHLQRSSGMLLEMYHLIPAVKWRQNTARKLSFHLFSSCFNRGVIDDSFHTAFEYGGLSLKEYKGLKQPMPHLNDWMLTEIFP